MATRPKDNRVVGAHVLCEISAQIMNCSRCGGQVDLHVGNRPHSAELLRVILAEPEARDVDELRRHVREHGSAENLLVTH